MNPRHRIESFKFWDVAALWSNERLEHESVIARALAQGIVDDGLRFQSVDPRWLRPEGSLSGRPYVGYSSDPSRIPVLLRIDALQHLLAVVRQAAMPSRTALAQEFVTRGDFRAWLDATGQPLPSFWFAAAEGHAVRS